MDEIDLGIPRQILESLPDDETAPDMERAVEGYQQRINRAIDEGEEEAAATALDVVEHLEERAATYDGFVPELRAWGQSPIYAICWRNLCADLVAQLYDHEGLADHLDRERNLRVVEDGIRLSEAAKD